MYMKKLRASDWLETSAFACNTSAKLWHECKLQIARARFQNCFCLDFLWFFFHVHYCTLHVNFSKTVGSCKICCLWKIYLCLWTLNWTQNNVITHTYSCWLSIIIQSSGKILLPHSFILKREQKERKHNWSLKDTKTKFAMTWKIMACARL